MTRLTKSIVEAAEPRAEKFTLWCSDLKGFGVFVYPSGKRAYFVDYRNKDGGRKRMTLGRHGVITCEEARKLAMQTLGGVALSGDDPLTERQTRRSSLTVAELCADYLKAAENGLIMGKGGRAKKASTLATDRGRVQRHIVPLLGKRLVRDLTRADVAKFIRDVTAGKTAVVEKTKLRGKAVVEGGRGAAARTAGLLGGILSFAASEGVIEHNPARGVKRPSDGQRTRRLTPEEYRKLGDALRQAEDARETWQGVAGSRLLALTGCRLGEIVSLKWTEVDNAGGCFRLEDSKEGASTRPIGRPALDLLSGLEREDGETYVLPAVRSDGSYGGLEGAFERLAKKAGLEGVTRHTMRHSFASVAGDLGFSESTIKAMLGHAGGSVTSRYVHHLDSVLVAAADKVARAIDGYMTGAEAKVVELPKRGRKGAG
ncbi:site-specific integrase [Methylosinus sp. PW1]|uniref:tyrosine-type recombinase/integrase n=1 Tax=Methylosinus sp. PW1 TaxID=107636 RepID=UPI00055F0645|nr:site-specific integrase [Methylosinus sp. PW1]